MIEGYPYEDPKNLPKAEQIALKYKKKIQQQAAEEQKTGYDPTMTPSSIADVGQSAEEARFRVSLNEYTKKQEELRQLERAERKGLSDSLGAMNRFIQNPNESKPQQRNYGPMGNLGRYIQKPEVSEKQQIQQEVRQLETKMLDRLYQFWDSKAGDRPEAYTAENAQEYLKRIEMLSNAGMGFDYLPALRDEAKEVLNLGHPVGTLGNGSALWNFPPYQDAVNRGDREMANRWSAAYTGWMPGHIQTSMR